MWSLWRCGDCRTRATKFCEKHAIRIGRGEERDRDGDRGRPEAGESDREKGLGCGGVIDVLWCPSCTTTLSFRSQPVVIATHRTMQYFRVLDVAWCFVSSYFLSGGVHPSCVSPFPIRGVACAATLTHGQA
ncbi:unnamed protein product [Scytosiphon promiscuus]